MKTHNGLLLYSLTMGFLSFIIIFFIIPIPKEIMDSWVGDAIWPLYLLGTINYMLLVTILSFLYGKERTITEMWEDMEEHLNDERRLDEID